MENPAAQRHGHAVVIGAGIAGLLACRVLARHFERVTLVEREALSTAPDPRRCVPQSRHAHEILLRGEQTIVKLFPGLVSELVLRGAAHIEVGRDVRSHQFGHRKSPFRSSLRGIGVSRPLLELAMRERVCRSPGVRILDGTVVTRFAADWDCSRVTGVYVRRRDVMAPDEPLHADLVVDASGAGSRTPELIEALGYARPEESTVELNFGYASRVYECPPGPREWRALHVVATPPERRGGHLIPIEGNRWLVTLFGWHGDHPPADDAGFLAFARSLPTPDLHAAIARAKPIDDFASNVFPASRWRHYERLARIPARLVVLGDALCTLNPAYSQGMTLCALAAETLDSALHDLAARSTPNLDVLGRNFHGRIATILEAPWQVARLEDLRYPQTSGPRSPILRFLQAYTARLHEAAGESDIVAERLCRVANMLAPRRALFGKDVLFSLLRTAWRKSRRAAHAPTCVRV